MKKLLLVALFGFILAQACEYGACALVNVAQNKCYPLWTQGKQEQYQKCMENNVPLKVSNVIGFNFIYFGRMLILGY